LNLIYLIFSSLNNEFIFFFKGSDNNRSSCDQAGWQVPMTKVLCSIFKIMALFCSGPKILFQFLSNFVFHRCSLLKRLFKRSEIFFATGLFLWL